MSNTINPVSSAPASQLVGNADIHQAAERVAFEGLYQQNALLDFVSDFIQYLDSQKFEKDEGTAESGMLELEELLFKWFIENHLEANLDEFTQIEFKYQLANAYDQLSQPRSDDGQLLRTIAQINAGEIKLSSLLVFKLSGYKEGTLDGYSVIKGCDLFVHDYVIANFKKHLENKGASEKLFNDLKMQLSDISFDLEGFAPDFISNLQGEYSFHGDLVVTDEENQILNIVAKMNYILGLLSTRFYPYYDRDVLPRQIESVVLNNLMRLGYANKRPDNKIEEIEEIEEIEGEENLESVNKVKNQENMKTKDHKPVQEGSFVQACRDLYAVMVNLLRSMFCCFSFGTTSEPVSCGAIGDDGMDAESSSLNAQVGAGVLGAGVLGAGVLGAGVAAIESKKSRTGGRFSLAWRSHSEKKKKESQGGLESSSRDLLSVDL